MSREPLLGFLPRKVTSAQVQKALEGDVNPFTKQPHSASYHKILKARQKLPVYAQMEEFYNMVSADVNVSARGRLEPASQATVNTTTM
ncbi:hypothetical protein OF83DRAFT_1123433 [Amylostereum chailletii]|nr:hypothetical protein OF83DRAFT_1123433 [Amylostereum chailletii]